MTDKLNALSAARVAAATYTRRQMIAGSAVAFGGLAVSGVRAGAMESRPAPAAPGVERAAPTKSAAPSAAPAETGSEGSAGSDAVAMVKAIHQEEDYDASPPRIYSALLDTKQFTAVSDGRVAEIDRNVGGAFSLFAGHIIGRQLELVPDRRIVQAWRVVTWPEGIYSIARFELRSRGSGTRLVFDHTGFPPDLAEHLATGWQGNYWKPLRKYLGQAGTGR